MDWWHIVISMVTIFSTVAIGLNWIYRRDLTGMQAEIKAIIKRLDTCPGVCSEHGKTTAEIIRLIDIDEKLDRIYRMMLYLIKKNYFHRHTEDGKTLVMADGLEEFIKDVNPNNK